MDIASERTFQSDPEDLPELQIILLNFRQELSILAEAEGKKTEVDDCSDVMVKAGEPSLAFLGHNEDNTHDTVNTSYFVQATLVPASRLSLLLLGESYWTLFSNLPLRLSRILDVASLDTELSASSLECQNFNDVEDRVLAKSSDYHPGIEIVFLTAEWSKLDGIHLCRGIVHSCLGVQRCWCLLHSQRSLCRSSQHSWRWPNLCVSLHPGCA